ncbi:MAG: ATP-binding protein [Nannocystaceae bacterium]
MSGDSGSSGAPSEATELDARPIEAARHALLAGLAPELLAMIRSWTVDDAGEPVVGLARAALERLRWVLPIDRGLVGVPGEGDVYSRVVAFSTRDAIEEPRELPRSEGLLGVVLGEGRSQLRPRGEGEPAALAVPVQLGGSRRLALAVESDEPDAYGAGELRLLEDFAVQVAVALERYGLEDRLRSAEGRAQAEAAARSAAETAAREAQERRAEHENVRIDELLKGNARLREEIENLRREEAQLRQQKNAAEAANRAKSAFLTNMSHELRNPLNAIIGYGEMLQEQAEEQGYEDIIPDLGRICMSGQYLMSTLHDVIDMSKIESGRVGLTIQTFDIAELVREVAGAAEPMIEQKGNKLEVHVDDELGTMHADMGKVRQVLFNVLVASSRLTTDGEISVSVWRDVFRGAERVILRVRDDGIGMNEEEILKIFASLAVNEASSSERRGGRATKTGDGEGVGNLGLAISRYYCQLMGGNMLVESRLGLGTTYTIRLPATVGGG